MTVRDALNTAAKSIERRDAETLLMSVLERDRAALLAHPEAALAEGEATLFLEWVQRRAEREPLQHLTGAQEFFGIRLRVTPATLIPRPETEHLVEAVLQWCQETSLVNPRILDVGTGSGAIALALAAHLPKAHITASDISEQALQVARAHAEDHGLTSRVRFVASDLLAAFAGEQPFDILTSNPPYIPETDTATLEPEVVDHEPHLALFGGIDGLDIYRRLVVQAAPALRPGGLLAMELGYGQADAVGRLLAAPAWNNVRFLPDYAGILRVVLAERGGGTTTGA